MLDIRASIIAHIIPSGLNNCPCYSLGPSVRTQKSFEEGPSGSAQWFQVCRKSMALCNSGTTRKRGRKRQSSECLYFSRTFAFNLHDRSSSCGTALHPAPLAEIATIRSWTLRLVESCMSTRKQAGASADCCSYAATTTTMRLPQIVIVL